MPHTDKPSKAETRLDEREEDVQACIIEGLEIAGYTVLQTTVRYRACWSCGERQRGGYGATEGVPDLLVTHCRWPRGVFLGIECKGTKTALSPAQKRLEVQERIVVARRWETAWEAVQLFEQRV